MKRFIILFLLVCLTLPLSANSVGALDLQGQNNVVLLSSLDEEQCIVILREYGVSVPKELSCLDLPALFRSIENNPDMNFSFGWVTLEKFVEEVRSVVKSYYGFTTTLSNLSNRATSYTLQHSTLHLWDPDTMRDYNCYAYAIGRTSVCQPGDFSNQSYDGSAGITVLAKVVKDDLKENLNFACVKTQSVCPSSVGGWTNAIAIKKDTTGDYWGVNDYHVSKLSAYSWYHKPGRTAILKFITAPSSSVAWTNEAYNGAYLEPTITYDSSVMFLLYKPSHGNTDYAWTGEHYHAGEKHYYKYTYRCQDCQDDVETVWISKACSGPPCLISANKLADEYSLSRVYLTSLSAATLEKRMK